MMLLIVMYNEVDDAGVSGDDEDEDKHSNIDDDTTPSSATRVEESISVASSCELTKQAHTKVVEERF